MYAAYDRDFPGTDLDVDLLDFEGHDHYDAQAAEEVRALLTGLPARPGTHYAVRSA